MNQAHAIFGSPAHHMAIWCPLPTGVEYCMQKAPSQMKLSFSTTSGCHPAERLHPRLIAGGSEAELQGVDMPMSSLDWLGCCLIFHPYQPFSTLNVAEKD